jgi:hypothetical protein
VIFAVLDTKYSWAGIGIVDDTVEALWISPKVGALVESETLPGTGALFLGAMYLDFDLTISSSIPGGVIDPILVRQILNNDVDASPKERWNLIFGFHSLSANDRSTIRPSSFQYLLVDEYPTPDH